MAGEGQFFLLGYFAAPLQQLFGWLCNCASQIGVFLMEKNGRIRVPNAWAHPQDWSNVVLHVKMAREMSDSSLRLDKQGINFLAPFKEWQPMDSGWIESQCGVIFGVIAVVVPTFILADGLPYTKFHWLSTGWERGESQLFSPSPTETHSTNSLFDSQHISFSCSPNLFVSKITLLRHHFSIISCSHPTVWMCSDILWRKKSVNFDKRHFIFFILLKGKHWVGLCQCMKMRKESLGWTKKFQKW